MLDASPPEVVAVVVISLGGCGWVRVGGGGATFVEAMTKCTQLLEDAPSLRLSPLSQVRDHGNDGRERWMTDNEYFTRRYQVFCHVRDVVLGGRWNVLVDECVQAEAKTQDLFAWTRSAGASSVDEFHLSFAENDEKRSDGMHLTDVESFVARIAASLAAQ